MGVAKNQDGSDSNLGWFLGGNQSGRLQPKLYELNDMTFGSTFSQQDHTANKHYYDNVEEMARIKLEDGTWTKSNVSGWGYGTKNKLILISKYMLSTSKLGSKQWTASWTPNPEVSIR